MKKPNNYNFELCDGAVIIYRSDRNIGRIAVVFKDSIRLETSHKLPNYVLNKAKGMLLPENVVVLKKPIRSSFANVVFPSNVELLAKEASKNITVITHPQKSVLTIQVNPKNILYHNCEWLKENL